MKQEGEDMHTTSTRSWQQRRRRRTLAQHKLAAAATTRTDDKTDCRRPKSRRGLSGRTALGKMAGYPPATSLLPHLRPSWPSVWASSCACSY